MKKIYYVLAFSIYFLNANAWASFGPSLPLMEKMVTWKKQAIDKGIEQNKSVAEVIQLIDKAVNDCGLQIQGGTVTSASKRSSMTCSNSHSEADTAMRKLNIMDKATLAKVLAEMKKPTRTTVTIGLNRARKGKAKT